MIAGMLEEVSGKATALIRSGQARTPEEATDLAIRIYCSDGRCGTSGLGGDAVTDASTWIPYGNDIIERSKSGNVGSEALRAAQNINTFLGNRGDELQAASPATVDALGEMADKLSKIASGQIKYDSVSGAFFDEFGNAVRGEVLVGTQAVLDAPKKIVKYAADEIVKPILDVIPWYVWAGAAGIAGIVVFGATKQIRQNPVRRHRRRRYAS